MEDARSLAAIDTAERFADGLATTEELAAALPVKQFWMQGCPEA